MDSHHSGFDGTYAPPPLRGEVASGITAQPWDQASGSIRVLPAGIAAGIAAGETIDRPASVVKELVENALDAGARSIRIDIRGGGLDLIRVGDDGCGIRAAELWLACQRHATSKYPAAGLDEVRTLGFRGEALPSIAAVAELDLVSAAGNGSGWRLTLRGGRAIRDEPAARTRGTTVTVRGLFADLPARRATFAGATTRSETTAVSGVVRRLALAAPQVRISLHVEDRMTLQTTGSGTLATALGEVYGPELLDFLSPIGPIECQGASITGALTGADMTRPGRSGITIMVNGRPVNGRGLQGALETAYRPLLPRGRHPVLVLVIDIDPKKVDVNVHPGKLEVRLRGEREIGAGAGELVRESFGRRPLTLRWEPLTGADALRRDAAAAINDDVAVWDDSALIVTPGLPLLRLIGQVAARLLILEGEAGLYIVDQHRAHERILYERMRASEPGHGDRFAAPVHLPDPLLIELPHGAELSLGRRLGELRSLGFEIEEFGGRSFLLRAAPVLPGVLTVGGDPQPLRDLADPTIFGPALVAAAEEAETAGDGETWQERLLVRLACRTAVRRGRELDRPMMRALVEGLGQTTAPAVCPHGSPLLMHVGARALEREFGW